MLPESQQHSSGGKGKEKGGGGEGKKKEKLASVINPQESEMR